MIFSSDEFLLQLPLKKRICSVLQSNPSVKGSVEDLQETSSNDISTSKKIAMDFILHYFDNYPLIPQSSAMCR